MCGERETHRGTLAELQPIIIRGKLVRGCNDNVMIIGIVGSH